MKPRRFSSVVVHVYKTHCPDCGQELAKTKAEIIAEDSEMCDDED
jgi:uncharacterized protein with PIN domain